MIERPSGLPRNITEKRFDDSKWRVFFMPTGVVVVTSSGNDLIKGNPGLLGLSRDYRMNARSNGYRDGLNRKWFRSGGNSDIYQAGDTSILVKEVFGQQSAWDALDRMDYLYSICQKSLPSNIRVPEHYAVIYSSHLSKQYLVMKKVNEGDTVQDINESKDISKGTKELVNKTFEDAKGMLDVAIANFFGNTGENRILLPDWHSGNVVVDFSTPTEESPFTLWIIDQ